MPPIKSRSLSALIPVYDSSIRKAHTTPKKLYVIDPGMIRALTLDYENDFGRLFENVIYLDLKRFGYTISYYLSSKGHEVDFLAESPRGEKKLFQVSWDITNPKTLDREQRALQAGREELQVDGHIITLDSYLRNGILYEP